MEGQIIHDEVVSDEVRGKIRTAVREELTSKDGEGLVQEMMEATELSTMAADPSSGMSRRAIRKMQLQAFKMAKRDRRRGTHVQHPQKPGRFDKQAVAYYSKGIHNLRINVKKCVEYMDVDLNDVNTCSAL